MWLNVTWVVHACVRACVRACVCACISAQGRDWPVVHDYTSACSLRMGMPIAITMRFKPHLLIEAFLHVILE